MLPNRPLLRGILATAAVLVVYYSIPWDTDPSETEFLFGVVVAVLGVLLLAWLILKSVTGLLEQPESANKRLMGLFMLLLVVIAFFSTTYFLLATGDGDEFVELETRTDALYFTMTTVATTGFGDVHASGQVSRALVTAQMGFNLIFVAMVLTTFSAVVRRRVEQSQAR